MPFLIDIDSLLAMAMLDAVYARSLPCIYGMGLQHVLL